MLKKINFGKNININKNQSTNGSHNLSFTSRKDEFIKSSSSMEQEAKRNELVVSVLSLYDFKKLITGLQSKGHYVFSLGVIQLDSSKDGYNIDIAIQNDKTQETVQYRYSLEEFSGVLNDIKANKIIKNKDKEDEYNQLLTDFLGAYIKGEDKK